MVPYHGRRVFLRLDDPLLPNPLFVELQNCTTTIGLHEEDDADVIMPWEKMRLLVRVEDSETGNTTVRYEPLCYKKLDMLCHPKGHPAFTLNFVNGCWEATAGHNMRLTLDARNPSGSHDHGSTSAARFDKEHRSFSLRFKCAHGERCPKVWEQILRFTLVEKEEATQRNAQFTSPPPAVPTLALETLASYLDPQELLNMLTVFPTLAKHRCRMKSIEISPRLESIRLCMVTIPNFVEEITCIGVAGASAELRNTMSNIWTRLLSSTSLKKLVTDDISVLRGVHLSNSLTAVRIEEDRASPPMREINMDGIRLPNSVTEFRVNLVYSHVSPEDFRPQGGAFFFDISRHLPSLSSLTLRPCPCREFWTNVDPHFFQSIAHLSIRTGHGSFFPLSLTANLQTLVFSGPLGMLKNMMENVTLPSLKALDCQNYWINDVISLSQILLSAPEVKILSLQYCSFVNGSRMNMSEAHCMQKLEYLRVGFFSLSEKNVPSLLYFIRRFKCFDLFCNLKVWIDEQGVWQIHDTAMISMESAVMESGGRVEIVHLEKSARGTFFGTLTSRCLVRVLFDQTFNFENILQDHPLLFVCDI